MTADIVTDALTMAWFGRSPNAGLIHHSDRGSQYASETIQAKLEEYGMSCSMSRKGNCWHDAPTENWFGSFKNERVYGERFGTRNAMKMMAFEYIEVFYNRKRLHSTLGHKSPGQFMQDWLTAKNQENHCLEDEKPRESRSCAG
jgi:putative transposase